MVGVDLLVLYITSFHFILQSGDGYRLRRTQIFLVFSENRIVC